MSAIMTHRWLAPSLGALLLSLGPGIAIAQNGDSPGETLAIESLDLGTLLEFSSKHGVGAFGFGLNESGVVPYLHAYGTFEWVFEQGGVHTFDMHYFNVFVGANIADGAVVPEIQLEYEHGNEVAIRYAEIDVRVHGDVVIRSGLFLVPFGLYNEFSYPEYLSILPRNPLVITHRSIIPVAWNDAGVQLRASRNWGGGQGIDAVIYVSNGLEQSDDPATFGVDDGGSIRDMRGNFRDKNHSGKAVGGRVNLRSVDGVDVGASVYSGVYTVDGQQRLTLLGAHAGYQSKKLRVKGEGVYAMQGTAQGALRKAGVFLRAGYQALSWLEPAVGLDWASQDLDAEVSRLGVLGSFNFYPYPNAAPSLIARLAGGHYIDAGVGGPENIGMVQLTLGF